MIHAISTLNLPHRKDVRWSLLAFLLLYVGYAMLAPSFPRTFIQFLASLLTCFFLDILWLRLKKVPIFPLSGIISSLGVFLLCDSPTIWAYVLVAALTIASKHLFTTNRQHIFNPNNFALVIAVLYFEESITIVSGNWGGNLLLAGLIAIFGAYVSYRAERWSLVLSYALGFLLLGVFRSMLSKLPLTIIWGPATGAAFQLFIFYMITDPKTTPNNKKQQIFFGTTMAFIDAGLRMAQNKYAPFIALFTISSLQPAIQYFITQWGKKAPMVSRN